MPTIPQITTSHGDTRRETNKPLSVLAFPRVNSPYTDCFYASVEAAGLRVVEGIFAGRWLLERRSDYDIVHFHWPSFCYFSRSDRGRNWLRLARFALLLLAVRMMGKEIVWTAHNMYPHDGGRALRVHRVGRWLVQSLAARILVHSQAARDAVVAEFHVDASKTVIIEHGHWIGYYANASSKPESRRRLGLPAGARVFYIERCVDLLRSHTDLALVYSINATMNEDGQLTGSYSSCYTLDVDDVVARFRQLTQTDTPIEPFYGVMRRQMLASIPRLCLHPGFDRFFLAELGLLGKFHQVPEPLYVRRIHGSQSVRAFPGLRDRHRWINSSENGRLAFPYIEYAARFSAAALRSAPGWRSKLACLWHMLKWCHWNRKEILGDLVGAR